MHVLRVEIENIRSIRDLRWEVPADRAAGWHVIVGDNGSGKSSFLRAIAITLADAELLARHEARATTALRQGRSDWLRRGAEAGRVTIGAHIHTAHNPAQTLSFEVRETVFGSGGYSPPRAGPTWLAAAYGPFRRFTGGDVEYERAMSAFPELARYLSIFDERVALTAALEWLRDLKFKSLESAPLGSLLSPVVTFLNDSGLLPHDVHLKEVTSDAVLFVDGSGVEVPIEELSDGYRSILSLTLDLLRHISAIQPAPTIFSAGRVTLPGIVLIDEIDVHLHPTWQRTVGLWFREHFPNVQFIVSSHSPLVCQAADAGTVFLLPRPGSDDEGRMLGGIELDRILYGNVLDAYGTDVFGRGVTRSDASKHMLHRLAELNAKQRNGGLTADEREELVRLRNVMPSDAYTVDAAG